jgi:transposase
MDLHINPFFFEYEKLKTHFAESEEKHQKEIRLLKEQIQYLAQKLYGRKSEKIPYDDKQLLLFEEMEDTATPVIEQEEIKDTPAKNGKKRGRKALPPELPRVDVIHDLDENDKICECGCAKTRCGEETSEQYDVVPATYRVIRHIRYKYACKNCEGVESEKPTVMIAPPAVTFLPRCNATEGLIAQIIVHKFADALPFYRQQKILARHDIEIPRATMCNWTIMASENCVILLELLQKELLSGPLINVDETTVQVHKEHGRKNTSTSYMWVFCGGPPTAPVVLFTYDPTREGRVANDFLCDYRGFVQTDGYAGYNFLDGRKDIVHVGCWAHARRKFMEAAKLVKKPKDGESYTSAADEAVAFIRKLYAVEKEAKEKSVSFEEWAELRLEKSKPVLDAFKAWLLEKSAITLPKSALGKSIAYTLSQWDRLVRYMDDVIIQPDNNRAENAIRPFVLGRKNWLFSDTPGGAKASATFYSLIETAKANSLEPASYLKYIFLKLPYAKTIDDHKALLPQYLDRDVMAAVLESAVF